MTDKITQEQYNELEDARSCDRAEYHQLLSEYAEIVAQPYTAFSYYDKAGNYLGDSSYSTLDDLLESAYIEVSAEEGG